MRQDGYVPVAKFLNDTGTELDRAKFIRFMVEIFGEDTEELSYLFGSLHVDMPRERVQYLLQGRGMACYYLLFQCMRQLEHERDLLVRCCQFLMKKGDALSFNLASVAKAVFRPDTGEGYLLLASRSLSVGMPRCFVREFL